MPVSTAALARAADLVEQEVSKLNQRESTCPCCGLNKRENWAEWQAAKELTAIVMKIRRFARSDVAT
jgi:hypothetical protein